MLLDRDNPPLCRLPTNRRTVSEISQHRISVLVRPFPLSRISRHRYSRLIDRRQTLQTRHPRGTIVRRQRSRISRHRHIRLIDRRRIAFLRHSRSSQLRTTAQRRIVRRQHYRITGQANQTIRLTRLVRRRIVRRRHRRAMPARPHQRRLTVPKPLVLYPASPSQTGTNLLSGRKRLRRRSANSRPLLL
jgi:hypothetical protein